MFSQTAYEAMYQYIGLALHTRFVEIITSLKVFVATMALIFGVMFFVTTAEFFSRYMPGALVRRKSIALSKFVKIVACLFLATAILQVGSKTQVKRFSGQSWDQNPYVRAQLRNLEPQYRVSFVFDILSRSAEEVSALIARVVDTLFQSSHSQLEAPNFFFKAIMFAGASTMDDPNLKRGIRFYTEECFDRLLPLVKDASREKRLDGFFADGSEFNSKLAELKIETEDNRPYTCLDVKTEVTEGLKLYALEKSKSIGTKIDETVKVGPLTTNRHVNLEVSKFLVDYYNEQHEGWMGIQKGSELPTAGFGSFIQYANRFFSWDGFLSVFGAKDLQGAALAANRSQEFSENLARAPHVAGFIKMLLIALFPWLIFLVVAGHWKVLAYWFLTYFSVLLWTPIWTLLYHIMIGISLSSDVMESFGKLTDGISLYSAELISSRIYHLFAVYSWLQLLTGTLFTGAILYFIKPLLSDSSADSAPEFIDESIGTAKTGGKLVGMV